MSLPRFVLVLRGSGSSAFGPYVSLSLGAHAVFLLLLVLGPSLRGRRIPPGDALVAVLVPGPPGPRETPAAAPAQAKPEPPKPTPPKPEPAKAEPRAIPLGPKNPKKTEKPAPRKEAAPQPPQPAKESPPAESAPGSSPAGPAASTGAGITSLDSGDVEFAWYRARVTSALKSRWVRPVLEGGDQETIAASVSFEILRDGSVADVRIETSSGVPAMDRSVLRAVLEASPLPPPPAAWRDATMPARFEFRWRAGDPS